MFFITCLCHFFSSLSTCLSWGLPSHSSRSLSQAATDIWTTDSGISYTGSIGWRITGPSVLSNTESTLLWMDDKASSLCLKTGGTYRSRHSKSMDNTSLNHSDIFILMIGTYLSLFKCLVRLTTQWHCILAVTRLLRPPIRPGMHTDLISNSALLGNNFVLLLSDL